MMERHEHTNPWADKLQEVQLPDANDSWSAMEVLLDKEMPLGKQHDKRRWLLLILLLLLLIGVCNCPRQGQWNNWGRSGSSPASLSAKDDRATAGPIPDTPASDSPVRLSETHTSRGPNPGVVTPGTRSSEDRIGTSDSAYSGSSTARVPLRGSPATREKTSFGPENSQRMQMKVRSRISHTPARLITKKNVLKKNTRRGVTGQNIPGGKEQDENKMDKTGGTKPNSHPGDPVTTGTRTAVSGTTTPGTTTPGSTSNKGKDSTAADSKKNGDKNIAKKQPAPTEKKKLPENKKPAEKSDSVEPIQKGFVAGIGFNQFFSVGQQQKSDYNSGGTSGGVGDYLPIPMIRYYFSRKLFVQIEAQFNTPQYTKKNLVAGQSAGDTLSPGLVQQNSVVIKKLFYFNLPLSVHYSPLKNLYVGAGLQYSRLSNGVGLYENKVLVTGGTDTVKSAKVYSFKGDSIYQKMRTNEFRFLVDLSYTYKRFIIGARYNQALSKFLNVRISDTQVTQARNSSLQLYIRYILCDGRKKKGSSSK